MEEKSLCVYAFGNDTVDRENLMSAKGEGRIELCL